MRFEPWKCPVCGDPVLGVHDTIPALAYVDAREDGEAEFTGETKVYWDGQTTDSDSDGLVTLGCANGHQWQARMTEG